MFECAGIHLAADPSHNVASADLAGRIEDVFGFIRSDEPGAAIIVTKDGGIVTMRHYGLASLEHGIPFTPNHVVRLPYSEGREFLAIASVLMENDGLINLDDRVRSYVPQLPAWSEEVTIRDLIFHHSGFVDEWSALLLMHASMENRFDKSQFLRLLSEQPLPEVEPGTGYMYSNSDYGLLRLILESRSDGDLQSYLARRLFGPLGMNSTRLMNGDKEVIPGRAPFYSDAADGYHYSFVKTSPGGNYAIATTACDLARWAEAFSDPDSEVKRAVTTLMDGETPIPGRDGHYAFGQTTTQSGGHRLIRHEGVNTVNYLTRVPELGIAVITLGNRYLEPTWNHAIVDFLLGGSEAGILTRYPSQPVDVDNLERYAGRFVSSGLPSWESHTMARDLILIEYVDEGLNLSFSDWGPLQLVPLGGDTFSWHDGSNDHDFGMLLEFSQSSTSDTLRLVIRYNDGYPTETFVRPGDWTPSTGYLRKIQGAYHSRHLDYTWAITADESGKLIVRAPTLPDIHMEPYREGEFLLHQQKFEGVPENIWIRFHEDETGGISHLTAWHPRLMNHRFDRQ